jgi:hypothetical protein
MRHVYFFEPCTDRKAAIGILTADGAYCSHGTGAPWLTVEQRAAIRLIEEALAEGDDPGEISPQIIVVDSRGCRNRQG